MPSGACWRAFRAVFWAELRGIWWFRDWSGVEARSGAGMSLKAFLEAKPAGRAILATAGTGAR